MAGTPNAALIAALGKIGDEKARAKPRFDDETIALLQQHGIAIDHPRARKQDRLR